MRPAHRIIATVLLAIIGIPGPQVSADSEIKAGGKKEGAFNLGYSTKQQMFKGECMTGTPKEIGQASANLSYSQKVSKSDMEKELGLDAGGRFRYGASTTSMSAKFLRASTSNSYSINATYVGDYKFKNLLLTNASLSKVGEGAKKKLAEDFEKTCGDEFVSQIIRGAKLFFTIRVDFASNEDKSLFEASLKFKSSVAEAHASVKDMSKNKQLNASVTVGIYQLGGDISKVSKIFQGAETSKSEALVFVKCSMGEFAACDKALSAAIDYASNESTGFPAQLANSSDVTSNASSIAYITVPYKEANIEVKNPPGVEEAVVQARAKLAKQFESELDFQTQANYLLNDGLVLLSESQKTTLEAEHKKNWDNIQRLIEVADQCYEKDARSCVKSQTDLMGSGDGRLQSLNRNLLKPNLETFRQYCVAAFSPAANPAARDSMIAIIAAAKRIDADRFKDSQDDCTNAHVVLRVQTKLSLRGEAGKEIRQIDSLAEYKQLRDLDISNNNIEDLSPLAALENLQILNASRNRVSDVSPLKNLKHLKMVDVSFNVIRDSQTLTATGIERLDLRDNMPDLTCPKTTSLKSCLVRPSNWTAEVYTLSRLSDLMIGPVVVENAQGNQLIVGGNIVNKATKSISPFVGIHTFDPLTQALVQSGQTKLPRYDHAAVLLTDGDILVVGGIEAVDLELIKRDGTVETLPVKLSRMRAGLTATLLPTGKVLIAGGYAVNGKTLDHAYTAEIYDVNQRKVTKIVAMNAPRAYHTATILKDQNILIAGGLVNGTASATAEIFDWRKEQFISVGNMSTARGAHTATALKTGQVLVTGGLGATNAIDKAELFDPNTKKFTPIYDKLKRARGLHAATLLPSGDVLLTGGQSSRGTLVRTPLLEAACTNCLDTAEIYHAEEQSFNLVSQTMGVGRAQHSAIAVGESSVVLIGGSDQVSARLIDMLTLSNISGN